MVIYVLSRDELKDRQNLLASDYEIYMVCLFVATVYWHKLKRFVKKSDKTLLPCLFMIIVKFGYNARCHWLKERAL